MPGHHHSAVVHWSRWRALVILLLSTLCMSACADLATEHISPILTNSTISQVSGGMVVNPEDPDVPSRDGEPALAVGSSSTSWGKDAEMLQGLRSLVAHSLDVVRIRPCADVTSSLQYFIGVTVLAMVPELPEIVNGIQFALQNNLSLR